MSRFFAHPAVRAAGIICLLVAVSLGGYFGAKALFAREPELTYLSPNEGIVAMNAFGGDRRVLIASRDGINRYAWSPNGQSLAFDWFVPEAEAVRLVVTDAEGGSWRTVDEFGSSYAFDFSPIGTFIVYAKYVDGVYERSYLANVAGPVQATHPLPIECRFPDWSPDGRRIACVMSGGQGDTVVFVEPLTWTVLTDLSADGVQALPGSWSPDGSQYAYFRDTEGGSSLWIVASDGSGAEDVGSAFVPVGPHTPVWTPDGRYLYFTGWAPKHTDMGQILAELNVPNASTLYPAGHGFSPSDEAVIGFGPGACEWRIEDNWSNPGQTVLVTSCDDREGHIRVEYLHTGLYGHATLFQWRP